MGDPGPEAPSRSYLEEIIGAGSRGPAPAWTRESLEEARRALVGGPGRGALVPRGGLDVSVSAGALPISLEVLRDAGFDPRPWERADRNPFPKLDPTPRVTRLLEVLEEARARARFALEVLLEGVPVDDRDQW